MNTLNFVGTKKFRLIPIGKVSFTFAQKTKITPERALINANDMHFMCETDADISPEVKKALMSEMKKAKTDLLTDGHDFFTTRGDKITQIGHRYFYTILGENKELVHKLLFTDEFTAKEL